ncbi:hypothetical protein [Halorussus salinisoli]|uniref:hypothetical protein n=1 Tax=Halorussus salinisoli TaxID=2558242 RepID=UPI0010C194D5|nr:hypothetical protein [Halorussus salinisoli]
MRRSRESSSEGAYYWALSYHREDFEVIFGPVKDFSAFLIDVDRGDAEAFVDNEFAQGNLSEQAHEEGLK